MSDQVKDEIGPSIRRHVAAGLVAFGVMVGGVGTWAVTTDVSGAIIAAGRLVVDSEVKKVQHLTGGIVGEIRVREGDRVERGDVLVRLDETATRANLAIVRKSLDQALARRARLAAERDGADTIRFPEELVERASDPDVAEAMGGEARLFAFRRDLRSGRKAQLAERIRQLELEIDGLTRQREAKRKQLDLIGQERDRVATLYRQKLVEVTRVVALERELADLSGQEGAFAAQIAQASGKIAETKLQILGIDQEMAEQVGGELRDTEGKIGEFVERRTAAEDQLRHMEVLAPQAGIVHQLTLHTVGGVMPQGEPIALIVPVDDALMAEAKIQPQDVVHLHLGQSAHLRFSGFDQRTTPEIGGTVDRISPDVATDPRTGATYYTVRLAIDRSQMTRLGSVKLVPGMPVETFIETGDRSVASYFVKPLMDQVVRAFRET